MARCKITQQHRHLPILHQLVGEPRIAARDLFRDDGEALHLARRVKLDAAEFLRHAEGADADAIGGFEYLVRQPPFRLHVPFALPVATDERDDRIIDEVAAALPHHALFFGDTGHARPPSAKLICRTDIADMRKGEDLERVAVRLTQRLASPRLRREVAPLPSPSASPTPQGEGGSFPSIVQIPHHSDVVWWAAAGSIAAVAYVRWRLSADEVSRPGQDLHPLRRRRSGLRLVPAREVHRVRRP